MGNVSGRKLSMIGMRPAGGGQSLHQNCIDATESQWKILVVSGLSFTPSLAVGLLHLPLTVGLLLAMAHFVD